MNLNLRVIQVRKRLSLTQTDLAKKCNTTQQTIAKIEQGVVDPKLSTLEKLAEALDCELIDLFYTRESFAADVNQVVKSLGLNLSKIKSMDLNNICWEHAHISGFHPFWQKYKIKNNKIYIER